MYANVLRLGPPPFDARDRAFADEIRATLRKEDIVASYGRFGLKPRLDEPLSGEIYPLGSGVDSLVGSTDVGTVSWVVPTVQCRVATYAIGTPGHSWQLVAQGRAPAAHKGMVHAAKAMAATAADVLSDPELLARAAREHAAFRAENPFTNPIPDDLEPPLEMSRAAEAAR
jgi:aminobenzoyl-glutamate utilization protein B